MDKNELLKEAMRLIFEESRDLSREEYKDLLIEIGDACNNALAALEVDEEE